MATTTFKDARFLMDTTTFWENSARLDNYGSTLYHIPREKFLQLTANIRQEFPDLPETPYFDSLMEQMKDTTYSIAFTSGQSGGKSTLVNDILGYPLMPTAQTVTTTCAVEIRYGREPAVQVLYDNAPPDGKKMVALLCSRNFSASLWDKLKEYACMCLREKVLSPESLQYFSDMDIADEKTDLKASALSMTPNDPKHAAVLLMILLAAYVGQNNAAPKENEKRLCDARAGILSELGIANDRNYSLRVLWNNDILSKGLILLDLPGFDSIVSERKIDGEHALKSHDDISMRYMLKADAVFMLFDPSVLAGSLPKALDILLKSEKMKYVVTKENRIIPILNKVDLQGTSITTSTNNIRGIFEGREEGQTLQVPYVYPVSSIWGEFRFLEHFPFRRTLMYKWNHKKQFENCHDMGMDVTEDQIEAALKKKLEKEYYNRVPFAGANGEQCEISLDEFINLFTNDYLDRMRCLKGLELLNAGGGAYRLLLANLKGRAALLEVLRGGGKTLADSMVKSLKMISEDTMSSFNDTFGGILQELMDQFSKESDEGLATQKSYVAALEKVENDAASLIRTKVQSMEKNVLGDYIIDNNNDKAKRNLKRYQELKSGLQSFSVSDRLRNSGQRLTNMIQNVVDLYDAAVRRLCKSYGEFPTQFRGGLKEKYEAAVNALIGENEGLTREQFNEHYDKIFKELLEMVCVHVTEFSQASCDLLRADSRIADLQSKTIDSVAEFTTELESVYNKAFYDYVESAEGKTIFTEHKTYNAKGILANVDEPFIKKDTRAQLAAGITTTFNDYNQDILDGVNNIRYECESRNNNGLKNSINGMKISINQRFDVGGLTVRTQIDTIDSWIRYICNGFGDLQRDIQASLEGLSSCAWAAGDVRKAYEMFQSLESYHAQ